MKPVKFKEQNVVFAENQKEYLPLPALIDKQNGIVVCCWKLSFLERIRVLFLGRLWLNHMTFNQPLQPHLPSTRKSELILKKAEKRLPIYIPNNRANTDKLHLAIWDCGKRPQTFWQAVRATRITIRKNGFPILVIKKGHV